MLLNTPGGEAAADDWRFSSLRQAACLFDVLLLLKSLQSHSGVLKGYMGDVSPEYTSGFSLCSHVATSSSPDHGVN